jgi:putative transposase
VFDSWPVSQRICFVIGRHWLPRTGCSAGSPSWPSESSSPVSGDATAGPLTGFGQLIVDRDPLYTAQFRTLLQAARVNVLRLPANSPNLNAYAERFVRSIKHECLRHIVPLGEQHLRAVVREFVEHYHAERNHQGLGNVVPFPSPDSVAAVGRVERRQRLGGLLNFYERKAA